jgi:hypothetical protein
VSPFNYAENTPINAIDLWGLQAFYVHGTQSNPSTWTDNPYTMRIINSITGNLKFNSDFDWSRGGDNGFFNNEENRLNAARDFADHVLNNLSNLDENITLIGHSHGGNVAIQAVDLIREGLKDRNIDKKINLITIATPAYNGIDDPENPANTSVDEHYHIFSNFDVVQTKLANLASDKHAQRTYNNQDTRNFQIHDYHMGRVDRFEFPHKIYGDHNGVRSHSFHYYSPEQIGELNIDSFK